MHNSFRHLIGMAALAAFSLVAIPSITHAQTEAVGLEAGGTVLDCNGKGKILLTMRVVPAKVIDKELGNFQVLRVSRMSFRTESGKSVDIPRFIWRDDIWISKASCSYAKDGMQLTLTGGDGAYSFGARTTLLKNGVVHRLDYTDSSMETLVAEIKWYPVNR